jgi:CHRD domain
MHRFAAPRQAVVGGAFLASTAMAVALIPAGATATGNGDDHGHGGTRTHAYLNSLNNSGAMGMASATVKGRKVHVRVKAHGLAKGLPHAQHIHYGEQARNECPTAGKDDANGDFRLETGEGVPAYGPIAISLTTRGDTSPDSGLAVDRFPTAPKGHVHYERTTHTSHEVAKAIRQGEGVVVIHGVDYNGNGTYDFGAGKSDLDPSLPSEATDPAVCGVLHR